MNELVILVVVVSIPIGFSAFFLGWRMREKSACGRRLAGRNEDFVVSELAAGLCRLSARMLSDVNEHSSAVAVVDRELSQVGDQGHSQVGLLVERLLAANCSALAKLDDTEERLADLSRKIEQHATEARTDTLTGLANRRAFEETAVRHRASLLESAQPCSLIMIDIDRFKHINDVHGHPAGDAVLRQIAEVLRDQVRARDLVTRYGGEEFAILLPRTRIAETERVAESLRREIENTRFEIEGQRLGVTISLGVAEMLPEEDSPPLLQRADQALYAAKHAGRNRVYSHDGTLARPIASSEDTVADVVQRQITVPLTAVAPDSNTSQTTKATANTDVPFPSSSSRQTSGEEGETIVQAHETDPHVLSDIGSKTLFCQCIRHRIAERHDRGLPSSVLLLSIDNGRMAAGSHGETHWELLMGVVAQAAHNQLRGTDLLARVDDVTFGIVLPYTPAYRAAGIGERLRKSIQAARVQVDEQTIRFTISLSCVEVEDGEEMTQLVQRARRQLHKAQKSGGNRINYLAPATSDC